MSKATKTVFYILAALGVIFAIASIALLAIGDGDSSAACIAWGGYLLLLSAWVFLDSRIDL